MAPGRFFYDLERSKSMILRFRQSLTVPKGTYKAGFDYEVENADAVRYIHEGIANKAVEPVEAANVDPDGPLGLLKQGETVGPVANSKDIKPVDMPPAPPEENPADILKGTRSEPLTPKGEAEAKKATAGK